MNWLAAVASHELGVGPVPTLQVCRSLLAASAMRVHSST